MTELMHGAQFAKFFVTDYLSKNLESRLVAYRNGWGLDDEALPGPDTEDGKGYLTYEPIALDHWPSIITVCISTDRFDRMFLGAQGDPLYRVVYSMRTYIWVNTEYPEMATLMRDRLTTVVRSALLDRPCLMGFDAGYNTDVMLDEGTLREEFSDLTPVKADRVIAGAYLGYDLTLNEVIYRNQIGPVTEVQIEVDNL